MNDQLRAELERLKERQAQLLQAVDLLGVHIKALENRAAEASVQQRVVEKAAPLAVPPLLEKAESGNLAPRTSNLELRATAATVAKNFSTEPTPGPSKEGTVQSGNVQPSTPINREQALNAKLSPTSASQPATFNLQPATAAAATPPPLPPIAFTPPLPSAGTPAKPESFELRLGTYWLVRVGIVAMLTALVFFGTYAYQNYIGKIGPGGKVALLYLSSGALLGFGAWFQRRAARESLRNYAGVLFAGGLAAVYFTTYAAHYFPNLQVIPSRTLAGALLLGWAGFMAWMADRKKSEAFAMFAVGLAFYSSAITHVGYFTLYSNLVLAAVALFFLVRNRWAKLSFGSLIATYASYAFWRFWQDGGWHWAGPDAGLWTGVYFIGAYWAVFTAAVFLSQHKEFAGVNRATFITLNNAAFYALFLLTMVQVRSGGFWKFNLITGAVLLAAAALAKVRLRDEPLAANTYLTQGLLLMTVGLIAKFAGLQLALVLALECVVLWLTGTLRQNIVMRTGVSPVRTETHGRDARATIWVRQTALWYGRAAMGLLVWWTFQYAANRELVWSFTALGALAFAVAGWRKERDWLAFAAVLNLCALCSLVFHLMSGTAVYGLNLVAILAWMVEQQIARRQAERYPVPALIHNVAMVAAGVALWWLGSAWVKQGFSGFYLTASWSVYAFGLLALGMALRERIYRWLGLGVLGAALARVVFLDVWRLETLYRFVSLFALGLVLLVLGFLYNKYQDRIRPWL